MGIEINVKGSGLKLDKWWKRWTYECAKLIALYPTLKADREVYMMGGNATPGEWKITGPANGVKAARDLFAEAGRKIGFKGGDLGAVQFWLDHMRGDHIIKLPLGSKRRYDDRRATVILGDGTKKVYQGGQEQG